jgi:hypothetical protein
MVRQPGRRARRLDPPGWPPHGRSCGTLADSFICCLPFVMVAQTGSRLLAAVLLARLTELRRTGPPGFSGFYG